MTMFIECIYKFFENQNNLAEFEKWKEERKHSDEVNLDVESGCILDGYRNSRVS